MVLSHPDWWARAEPGIHASISNFAEWMQNKVATIKPHQLIVKNPYLFRARAPRNADQLAARLIDAFLSSSEETRFGDILESTAVAICRESKGGWKSSADGIDLEYDEDEVRTIMQIKSGTNWGNSSQRKKLVSDFQSAVRTLRQGRSMQVRCVEGICYGPSGLKDYGSHIRIVGNAFWQDISGWADAGRAVMRVVEQHAANGLKDVVAGTRATVVDYLQRSGVTTHGDVDWDRLYDLIMMPARERPR